jgi:C4-dicarboxylate-binding protein DctP
MTTGRPVRVPSDLKGLKIRVPESQLLIKLANLAGAVGTPIPFSEVYTSLQQRVVDGVMTGIVYVQATGITDLIKHINVANPFIGFGPVTINEKFYQSLSPADQLAVKEAAVHANAEYRGMAMYGETLWAEHFKQVGINISVPTPAEKEVWVKTLKQPILEWTKARIGSEWIDKFIRAGEQAEKELYGN